MDKFSTFYKQVLTEFNVLDRNDPAFYDYVVVLIQQLLQRGLIGGDKPVNVRNTAMKTVQDGYYNYIDEDTGVAYKIEFIFDTREENVNNLTVRIIDLEDPTKIETIENTHDEISIKNIGDFLSKKKLEKQSDIVEPTQVSNQPSALPQEPPTQTTPAPTPTQ